MDKTYFIKQLISKVAFFVGSLAVIVFILILIPWRIFGWHSIDSRLSFNSFPVLAEEDPLRVSDARVVLMANGQAIVTWETNKLSDGHIWYSADPSAAEWLYLKHDEQYRGHVIELPKLELSQRYYLKIVSRTLEGEEEGVPQMVFDSHEPRDLVINNIDWSQDSQLFAGFNPQPVNSSLQVVVANSGDQPITESFFVSALMIPIPDPETDATRTVAGTYSCFVETLVTGGLAAREEKIVDFGTTAWHDCDSIPVGQYDIVVAIDYADDVLEYNEDNNVSARRITVAELDLSVIFRDVVISQITSESARIDFKLENDEATSRVYIQYGPTSDIEQGNFRETLTAIPVDNGYWVSLDGLQSESGYSFRLLFDGSNAQSTVYPFMTLKNPYQDDQRLAALKISNPDCRRVSSQPVGRDTWAVLGLDEPPHKILRYRIYWSSGIWSPWYTPLKGDIDWVRSSDGSERRIWAYFDDHAFEYETCGQDINNANIKKFRQQMLEQEKLVEDVSAEIDYQESTQVLGVSLEKNDIPQPTISQLLQNMWLYTIGGSNY